MGIVLVLLAIPLVLRWVPRNRLYGFRTSYVLSSDDVWYRANTIFGSALLSAGLLVTAADLVVPLLVPSRGDAWRASFLMGVSAAVLATAWTAWRVYRRADRGHRHV